MHKISTHEWLKARDTSHDERDKNKNNTYLCALLNQTDQYHKFFLMAMFQSTYCLKVLLPLNDSNANEEILEK